MMFRQHSLTELEKRHLWRTLGVKPSHSQETADDMNKPVIRSRDFLSIVKRDWKPGKIRGGGARLSHEKRMLVLEARSANATFHVELKKALARG